MENILNQIIKVCLTTTEKTRSNLFISLLLISFINCTDMNSPKFEVFGDPNILRESRINIVSYKPGTYPFQEQKIETLLNNGIQYDVQNSGVMSWDIYLSYKDSLIVRFKFDNVRWRLPNHVNQLYVGYNDNKLGCSYIGQKIEPYKKLSYVNTVIEIDKFMEQNGVINEDEKKALLTKFQGFFDPSKQKFEKVKVE